MKLTWILVLLCIAGFAYGAYAGEQFYNEYGFSLDNLVQRPYVLVTSIFMHGSVEHLLSNVLVLIFFGVAVEGELGKRRTLLIFFLGAFAGDALSLLVYAPSEIAVGASAGIFALIGVGMLVKPLDLSFYPLIIPIPLALLGLAYAVYNVYGFITNIDPNVSYIAHFGGLFVGLAFGFRQQTDAKGVMQPGWRRGLKIIGITFLVMILIPLIWLMLQ
ncbi:MAG: rhomboid family intramembrane serine protease [Candidatus Aenigmarchaeota archaeon]|nr:rhomboid family intramembrane serine protease [Candidatus Aenigmarchaeota archaeon]